MFTYLLRPDLPAVPAQFLRRARDIAANPPDSSYVSSDTAYNTREIKINGTTHKTRRQMAYVMDPDWERWVDENLSPGWIETGVRVNHDTGSPVQGPHADSAPPKFKLYWLVEPGASGVLTTWYRQKNYPLHRSPATTVNDYDDLDEIDTIEIPPNQWLMFNGNILHGVSNLAHTRINLTVSFAIDHPLFAQYQFLHKDFEQLI